MFAIRDASGLRVGRTLDERNSQNPSKYQAKNANITKLHDKKAQKKFRHLIMLYCAVVHNLNLRIICEIGDGGEQAMEERVYILIDE